MQLSFISIISLGSVVTSVAAFNAGTDSCSPPPAIYKAKKPSALTECAISGAATPHVTYDCGAVGKVVYNFVTNTIRLASNVRANDGEFTIHGACFDKGHQVAHADLRMPTAANKAVDQTFAGLNRVCNLGHAKPGLSSGPALWISAYVMTAQELAECAKHPVKPI